MRAFHDVLALALVIFTASVVSADDESDESKVVGKIELLGGKVMRNGALPDHPVVGVDLSRSERFNDKCMNLLRAFQSLTALNLSSTKITDVGLKEVVDLTNLTSLELSRTQITDLSMREIGRLTNLKTLGLADTRITDAGLNEIGNLKSMRSRPSNGHLVP